MWIESMRRISIRIDQGLTEVIQEEGDTEEATMKVEEADIRSIQVETTVAITRINTTKRRLTRERTTSMCREDQEEVVEEVSDPEDRVEDTKEEEKAGITRSPTTRTMINRGRIPTKIKRDQTQKSREGNSPRRWMWMDLS